MAPWTQTKGVPGLGVRLYLDEDADNVPDTVVALKSTTTDLNGYYRFDNLDAGNYVVEVDKPNGFGSSDNGEEPDPDGDRDLNDNGVNDLGTVIRSNNVIIGDAAETTLSQRTKPIWQRAGRVPPIRVPT